VFGGAGFVGSHVADALSDRGHAVTIFDARDSQYRCSSQQMVVGDLLDHALVRRVVSECDVVYQFAGMADIDECRTRPVETVRTNVLGTTILLDACAAAKVRRFVYASTVYVYSQSGGFYRVSKQSSELYIEEFERQTGLKFTILRYGTLYGRRADRRNSVYRFLQEALEERRIVYYGDGEEIREYIHVADAARCSVDVLSPEYENQHVILTGHQPMHVKELMLMIREILGGSVEVEYVRELPPLLGHYTVTPYSFQPRIARKLVSSYYLDMGQGLLDCLDEIASGKGSGAPICASSPTSTAEQ
jgi:UDP-glucose 4-epimerase